MKEVILEYVFKAIWAILGVVVTTYVLPWIKNKLIPFLEDKHVYNLVVKAVEAAEKLAENNEINKKEYVMSMLTKFGVDCDETVEMYIESAVKELDEQTAKIASAVKSKKKAE